MNDVFLHDIFMKNTKFPDFKVIPNYWDGNNTFSLDNRLTTTEVTVEAADSSSDDNTSSTPSDDTSSNTADNGGEYKYFPITIDQLDGIDDFEEARCPEGTTFTVNGRQVIPTDVRLVVGNIETNRKKTVLDAIKRYNAAFDTDSTDMALYDLSLVDKKNAKVTVQNGRVWICLKYPDNLARQSEKYTFRLYHQKDDGTVEEIPVTCKPNGIWFGVRAFSPYVLTWNDASAGSANTGESAVLIWIMTALCVLSLAAAGAVVYRKRKTAAE